MPICGVLLIAGQRIWGSGPILRLPSSVCRHGSPYGQPCFGPCREWALQRALLGIYLDQCAAARISASDQLSSPFQEIKKTMKAAILASALAVQQAAGHALFQQLWVNGVDKSNTCIRMPSGNSPVSSVSGSDIRCNAGGSKGVAGKCAVAAGDTVTVEMHQVHCSEPHACSPPGSHIFCSNLVTETARMRLSAGCTMVQ